MQTDVHIGRSGDTHSTRVLEAAARQRVTAAVTRHADGVSVTGAIAHLGDVHVEIAVLNVEAFDHVGQTDRRHDVTLNVEDEIYWFRSDLLAIRSTPQGETLVLERPTRLSSRQRRRFWRAPVRQSTNVTVWSKSMDVPRVAAVLNVSAEGLACRADRTWADRLNVGDRLDVSFSLDADDEVYSTEAQLKARTDASDRDRVILRVQFDNDDVMARLRERLSSTLRDRS